MQVLYQVTGKLSGSHSFIVSRKINGRGKGYGRVFGVIVKNLMSAVFFPHNLGNFPSSFSVLLLAQF